MPRNLRFDNANSCCVPYDDPEPELIDQLHRLAGEVAPDVGDSLAACIGCGYEQNCNIRGCAVIRKALEALE